jgi:OPA family glycerol-3-phosphate transporter-like MFS transporter
MLFKNKMEPDGSENEPVGTETKNPLKYYKLLIFACWLAYTSAYVGRLCYGASIVTIIEDLRIDRAKAGLVSSAFFFCYGIGQLVNGILCSKYNVRHMIALALSASCVCNLILPFVGVSAMIALWAVNGLAQSVIWSSVIRIQSEYLPDKYIGKAIVVMSSTVAVGTFLSYGISSLFSFIERWRSVFFLSSAVLFGAAVVWFFAVGRVERSVRAAETAPPNESSSESPKVRPSKKTAFPFAILLPVFLIAVSNGFIKDGVNTWVPNILFETFNLKSYISIIITLILPLVSVFAASIGQLMFKAMKNHFAVLTVTYLFTSLPLLLLLFFNGVLPLLVLMFTLISCLMAIVNNILTASFPLVLRKTMRSGFLSGLINFFCYTGSTAASYLLGAVADASGWNTVFLLLCIVSAVILLLCLATLVFGKRTYARHILNTKS